MRNLQQTRKTSTYFSSKQSPSEHDVELDGNEQLLKRPMTFRSWPGPHLAT